MKVVLVDGLNLAWRSHFARINLATTEGVKTGVVYGVLKSIPDLARKIGDCKLIWCWEGPGKDNIKPWRKALYAPYKSNREESEHREHVMRQVDITKKMLTTLGYPQFFIPGLEADDLIGVVSRALLATGFVDHVYILTNDRDMFQCIEKNVSVLRPEEKKLVKYRSHDVERQFGVPANRFAAYKAIVGDSSDVYKGMPGVGPKTAVPLLNAGFDPSLASWNEQPKEVKETFAKVGPKWLDARLCYELAYIPRSVGFKHFSKETKAELKDQICDLKEILTQRTKITSSALDKWTSFCAEHQLDSFLAQRRKFFLNIL